jgi:nucleotide-binding universal stress UspA family protein
MSYKTILVNAQPSPYLDATVAYAARLAQAHGAHLIGLASTGLNELVFQCNAAAPGVALLPADLGPLTSAAREALARFTATASRLGAPSCEERLTDDILLDSMVLQSRYADLVVTGQHDEVLSGSVAAGMLPQHLILQCPRPVVVVPPSTAVDNRGARPLLAWDGGLAASRAVTAALPLLRRAQLVTLAVCNAASQYHAHGPQPGADLATYLARQGVKLDVVVRDTDDEVGAALLALAAERDADLLVMGCYGHTRLRELLLGGATRTVLHRATLPVLMAR